MKKNPRSKDFRYVYSNGLQIQTGPNEVTMLFGIKEDQSLTDETILEEVGVIMTNTSAKLLAYTLTNVIQQMERMSGVEVTVDPTRIAAVDNAIRQAEEANQKLKDASANVSPPLS